MKMNKIILAGVMTLVLSGIIRADRYRILQIKGDSVMIGKEKCVKGSEFDDRSLIRWQSPDQVMKVINLTNKRQYVVGQKNFRGNTSTLAKFIRVNYTSTRAASDTLPALPENDSIRYVSGDFTVKACDNIEASVFYEMADGQNRCFSVVPENGCFKFNMNMFAEGVVSPDGTFTFILKSKDCGDREISVFPVSIN